MFVKFIYLTIHPFISFSLHMNNETEFHCCTSLVRQASLLSWHQDQVVQRADPPCSRERSHPPAGSVHGQWQDQDDTRAKQNHPAQAEEQRRELAQSNWLFAHTHTLLMLLHQSSYLFRYSLQWSWWQILHSNLITHKRKEKQFFFYVQYSRWLWILASSNRTGR